MMKTPSSSSSSVAITAQGEVVMSRDEAMEKQGMRKALDMVHLGILWVERLGFLLFFLEVSRLHYDVGSSAEADDDYLFHQLSFAALFLVLLQLGRVMCCYLKLGAKEEEANLLSLLEEEGGEEEETSSLWSARAMVRRAETVERTIFVLERLPMVVCKPLLDGVSMVLMFQHSCDDYYDDDNFTIRTLLIGIAGFSLAVNAVHLVCFLVGLSNTYFFFVSPKLHHDTAAEEERRRVEGSSCEGWEEVEIDSSVGLGVERDPMREYMVALGVDEKKELLDRLLKAQSEIAYARRQPALHA